ncbi:MAG: ATP-binding cassette domain-containing protein [Cyanobium sp.]
MPEARLQWRGERLELQLPLTTPLRIGRDPRRCQLVLPSHWTPCSRLQAELHWDGTGWWLHDGGDGRPSANGTYSADGLRFEGSHPLGTPSELALRFGSVPEDRVELQLLGLVAPSSAAASPPVPSPAGAVPGGRSLDPPRSETRSAGSVRPASTPASSLPIPAAVPSASAGLPAGLPAGVLSIGRHRSCTIRLDDPTVSRLHALLQPESGGTALLEDRSSNGLFIGGRRAARLSRIAPGADLRIGRARFHWDGARLMPLGEQDHFGIEVRDLSLDQRLRRLSLSIAGGQLVALVGGSGAGKSSLLTTLAGQNPDYAGRIAVNGEDLRRSIGALRPLMGFVPQDDIVHSDLSVQEVLGFAARLRIPDRDARQPAVERVLDLLELDHRRSALVRELSGGQRKRVNIGMELVADPRLLFLDEPTSGLDPGLDRRMMRLLRQIADRGHTVLVVTHATANVNLCDQLVFLARGGRLCYSGPPSDCLSHFGVPSDFAEVYEHLDGSDEELQQISDRFQHSQSLPSLPEAAPVAASRDASRPVVAGPARSSPRRLRRGVSQLRTLLRRELLLCRRDRLSLVLNLLTAPLAIVLLAAAIHQRQVFQVPAAGLTSSELPLAIKVVFVISCACIWSGISSHIGAVARERPIYERERSFNLLPLAYVAAKAWLIVLLALPQALLIAVAASLFFELPSPDGLGPAMLGYGLAAFLTILATGSMALFLSTLVKDQRQAGSSSPLLLMPQLILSGVLFEIGSLTALYPLVASRWSVKLFGAYSWLERLHLEPPLPSLPKIDVSPYASSGSNVTGSVLMLLLQAGGFLALALLALRRRKGLRG